MKRRRLLATALIAPFLAVRRAGAQQEWPSQPIKLVVPAPPGSNADSVGRVMADRLGHGLPQRVLVDNKPGAGGVIGIEQVLRSPPDGHTLVLVASTSLNILPHLRAVPYDPFTGFSPVAQVGTYLSIVACSLSLNVSTLAELMALARSMPGKLNYGTNGAGSFGHLAAETLKHDFGVDIVHVPYKGTAELATALLAGDIQLVVDPIVLPLVKTGRVRALATYAGFRHPELPDVPSINEAGVKAVVYPATAGMMAPKGTPDAIVDRIAAAARDYLTTDQARETMLRFGVAPTYLDGARFVAELRAASDANSKIIAEAKITLV
jgi:tripartite-type tricarboxylate transporter receptor subunit TctC